MKKLLGTGLILWAALGALAPATGSANADTARILGERHNVKPTPKWRRWHSDRGQQTHAVPELDPSASAQALTVLLGGLFLSRPRRRDA